MNLLAFDTSTDMCSVALSINGELKQREESVPQQHASRLLPMIEELLIEADLKPVQLDALVFGRGPGSFTGVRIAAATAQGIAYAADIGVIGVSTLEALALRSQQFLAIDKSVALIDARMGQVYWACYQASVTSLVEALTPEQVSDPAAVQMPATKHSDETVQWTGSGSGAIAYAEQFVAENLHIDSKQAPLTPLAGDMLRLAIPRFEKGLAVSAALAVPVYLRDKVALTEKERARPG